MSFTGLIFSSFVLLTLFTIFFFFGSQKRLRYTSFEQYLTNAFQKETEMSFALLELIQIPPEGGGESQ